MSKRAVFLIFAAIVLCLGSSTSGVITTWNNTGVGDSWCTAGNWSDGVPGGGDIVSLVVPPARGPVVTTGCGASAKQILGPNPDPGETMTVDVNGTGTMTLTTGWNVRYKDMPSGTCIINVGGTASISMKTFHEDSGWRFLDTGLSYLNISGSPTITIDDGIKGGDLEGADQEGSMFYVNMSGGTVECHNYLIGDNGGGELNISGGLIRANQMNLGGNRGIYPIDVNVTGGEIRVYGRPPEQPSDPMGAFELPSNSSRGGVVVVKLHGGSIHCQNLVHIGTDDWLIDVEQPGEFHIEGDVKDEIDANVAAGQITAYDGDGTVVVTYPVDSNTRVTAVPPNPYRAQKGRPRHKRTLVDPNVDLSWKAGTEATTHHIYFGTSWTDVNTADTSSSVYIGPQPVDQNSYDPGPLELNTKYYWRIDEERAGGIIATGREWEFSTLLDVVDPNLLVWYKFDEDAGFAAVDSSGHAFTGRIDTKDDLAPAWLPDDGKFDGCLDFATSSGNENTVVQAPVWPDNPLYHVNKQISVAVWLRDTQQDEDNPVFLAGLGGDSSQFLLKGLVPQYGTPKKVSFRAGNDTNDVLEYDSDPETLEGWHLWVFVKDETSDNMQIYLDGDRVANKTGVDDTLSNLKGGLFGAPMRLGGSYSDNYDFVGKMDDFRLYNRALSFTDVIRLIRGGNLASAWDPTPGEDSTNVVRDTDLTWKPGEWAVKHNVYLGTSFDDVNDANTSDAVCKAVKQDANSYTPGLLELKTMYYWRIDEVNDANGDSPWKGEVWQFTVGDFLVVDDMESYDDDAIMDPQNPISYVNGGTWVDGWLNNSGSTVYLEYGEGATVRGGAKAMWYEYDNSYPGAYNYSEIYADTATGAKNLGCGKDWTQEGVKLLTMYFFGTAGNDTTETMYAALQDTPGNMYVSNYGDMSHVSEEEWHRWDVPLSDFWDGNNVDINDVNKIYIGFGDRYNPVAGGSGTVYFDDIRLALSYCNPDRAQPEFDRNEDCRVDFAEMRMMAGEWLKSDVNLGTVTAPSSAPVLYYKLDEPNAIIADFSGNGYDGTFFDEVSREPNQTEIENGRIEPGWDVNSLRIGGDVGIDIPPEVFTENSISQETSVCLWLKNAHPEDSAPKDGSMFDFREWDGISPVATDRVLAVDVTDGQSFILHDSSKSVTYAGRDWEYHTGWEHYAFVRDDSNLAIYVNGRVGAIGDSNGSPMATPGLLYLGVASDRPPGNPEELHNGITGNVDEFKIFNYALSAAEVAYLAGDGDSVFEMGSWLNLWDNESAGYKSINFKDYATLTEAWLEQILWP